MTISTRLSNPIIASLMRNRATALAISGMALAQGGLISCGLPGWPCPFLHALGVPCPGCGLSRAMMALVRGDWSQAMTLHAFAPVVLLALVLIAAAAVLPDSRRQALVGAVEIFERRTGLTSLALIGLLLYWAARLALMSTLFIQMLKG